MSVLNVRSCGADSKSSARTNMIHALSSLRARDLYEPVSVSPVRTLITLLVTLAVAAPLSAQKAKNISEGSVRSQMEFLASDALNGRGSGTARRIDRRNLYRLANAPVGHRASRRRRRLRPGRADRAHRGRGPSHVDLCRRNADARQGDVRPGAERRVHFRAAPETPGLGGRAGWRGRAGYAAVAAEGRCRTRTGAGAHHHVGDRTTTVATPGYSDSDLDPPAAPRRSPGRRPGPCNADRR